MGGTYVAGTAYPPGTPELTRVALITNTVVNSDVPGG
jgi:hypothetical protein